MTPIQSEPQSIHEEVLQLGRTLHDLQSVLRSQREILRQRNMTLPAEIFTLLEDTQIAMQDLIQEVKEAEETLTQFRALADTAAAINSTLDLETILNNTMDTVIRLTGAERGCLVLQNRCSGNLEYRAVRNLDYEKLHQDESLTISRSVVNAVMQSGEPIITTNAQDDPRFGAQDSVTSFVLRSILCTPLASRETGAVIGVIYVDNRIRTGIFGETELGMVSAFAHQVAVAIENARLFERIRTALHETSESRQLLNEVFTSIPGGIVITNSSQDVQAYNQMAARILNLPEPDTSISPARFCLPGEFQQVLEDTRREERGVEIELTTEIPGLGQRILSLKTNPLLNNNNDLEGVAMTVDDLTELRKHEAQMRAIRRYLPPAMVDDIQSIAQLDLGGVRREITVLYIDLQPLTNSSPDSSPRQQMTALNHAMILASQPIHEYGGIIDKYMGTEIMALFNTQLNTSDIHQWDAVRAALKIAELFAAAQPDQHDHPDRERCVRMGIHSGSATMGNIGSKNRREFTAIGDTINLAHRMLEKASCGEILVSQPVLQSCAPFLQESGYATAVDHGMHKIRGREQPTQIFQLLRKGS